MVLVGEHRYVPDDLWRVRLEFSCRVGRHIRQILPLDLTATALLQHVFREFRQRHAFRLVEESFGLRRDLRRFFGVGFIHELFVPELTQRLVSRLDG